MVRRLFILPIRAYRLLISPFLPRACIFSPSCSEYAAAAIEKYGPGRGLVLAMQRILKCNPFHEGGADPVP